MNLDSDLRYSFVQNVFGLNEVIHCDKLTASVAQKKKVKKNFV